MPTENATKEAPNQEVALTKKKPWWQNCWVIGVGIFLLMGISGLISQSYKVATDKVENNTTQVTTPQAQNTETEDEKAARLADEEKYKLTYSLYKTGHNNRVENFEFLMKGTPRNDAAISDLVKKAKSENCTRSCNVYLYNDEEAANLDYINSFTSEVDGTKYEQWMKDHYSFIADHLVASIEFTGDKVNMYPYKDTSLYNKYK